MSDDVTKEWWALAVACERWDANFCNGSGKERKYYGGFFFSFTQEQLSTLLVDRLRYF